jgi:molybdopterin/thiamine biosynthesis adenylyltransferase/rhodanese-related sulfurtransferase
MELTDEEKHRYHRQLLLPGFEEKHQVRLKQAHVMVIGLGGLGNPVAQYLAAAGVGKLTLIDFDVIEASNLHRQLLFGMSDCGKSKSQTAAQILQQQYPGLEVLSLDLRVKKENISNMLADVDLIADCTDNFEARYAIDAAAKQANTPIMFGAIHRSEGVLSLFHASAKIGYCDLYPHVPAEGRIASCSEEGIMGPIAGIVGSMMAQGILEFLAFGRCSLDGKMARVDASNFSIYQFQLQTNQPKNDATGSITGIGAAELQRMLSQQNPLTLIDVRQPHEHSEFNIGGSCLPAYEVKEWGCSIQDDCPILLYCDHGHQSFIAARYLNMMRPELRIMHLQGGLQELKEVQSNIRLKA